MTQNHLFWRRLILLGAPLALGILDLTHPIHIAQTGVFGGVGPRVDWWITLSRSLVGWAARWAGLWPYRPRLLPLPTQARPAGP